MLKIKVQAGDFGQALRGTEDEIAGIVTRAMQQAAETMKAEARGQIRTAGMSQRLANTWRSNVYPENRKSLNPATYLWSAAPEIISSMTGGVTIRPRSGGRYLAIPTKWCPKRKRAARGAAQYMTPLEVERAFNQDLIFRKTEGGALGAFVNVVRSKNRKRAANHWRVATTRRRAAGREPELVMMFTMVPVARMPKRVDLEAIAQAGQQAFPRHLQDNWR